MPPDPKLDPPPINQSLLVKEIQLPGPWQKYSGLVAAILLALTTFLGGMRQVTPTPLPVPPPAPHNDKVQPAPPEPSPQPAPSGLPVADFTVTDSAGNLVTSAVGCNQQLIINASKAVKGSDPSALMFVIEPAVQKYQAGDLMILTTPPNFTVLKVQQIVALNNQLATKTVTIQIGMNQGPQPPPGPGPTPLPFPQPQPTPAPVKRSVSVFTFENPKNRTPDTAIFLEGMRTWPEFKTAGNHWKNYDLADDTIPADLKTALASAGPPPSLVIKDSNGTILYANKLPSPSDRVQFIKQYTGDI